MEQEADCDNDFAKNYEPIKLNDQLAIDKLLNQHGVTIADQSLTQAKRPDLKIL